MVEHVNSINAQYLLDGAKFPSEKAGLVAFAEKKGGSEEAIEILRALPEKRFHNIQEVNDDLGLIKPMPMPANQFSSQGENFAEAETEKEAIKKATILR
jgi:hypothetical protein